MAMFDQLFAALGFGRAIRRTPEAQARVDAETASLGLYHFGICPYCRRVRSAIKRLSLSIELHDIRADSRSRQALLQGGGKDQVPCLRIRDPESGDRWLYESADIVAYLERRFGHGV